MRGARTLLVIFIAIGLLVFGCTAPSGPGTTTTPGTAGGGNQAAGGAGTGAGAETGTGAARTGTGAGTGTGTGAATGGTTNYAGMAYAQLIGLGVPLQCDITSTSSGAPVTSKLYMKGEGEMRIETPMEGQQASTGCTKSIFIMKGTTSYVGCEGGSMFSGTSCDWLMMESEPSAGGGTAGGAYEAPDYSNVPSTQISCVPWVYDASKFMPSDSTCTLQDLMGGQYQYPS